MTLAARSDAVVGDDLFDLYRPDGGVVIMRAGLGIGAAGRSTAVDVPAGADQVGRAAELASRWIAESGAAAVVMGAVPFDGSPAARLQIPDRVAHAVHAPPGRTPGCTWTIRDLHPEPLPREYERAVEGGLEAIESGAIEKVVLARTLVVEAASRIDPRLVARRLRSADPECFVFAIALPGGSSLVGASPELVVRRAGQEVSSEPLAGTARRSSDRDEDAAIARRLLDTVKEQREHRLVAEAVADALAPFCQSLEVDAQPSLSATATLWHLRTAIRGTLRADAPDALTLAAALHPTPAVCGTPTPQAMDLIRRLERFDRRFYAGLVGWVDARGDGEWALALRCAEIDGRHARLFAGAGIVAGSDPAAEDLETEAKFGAMLTALGVDTGTS